MDVQKLGRKVWEAYLAKRLTQNKVVDDFITRNMLGQIESGAATPSVKTLEYLSKVLFVPMSQLVLGDDPIETLTRAKTALAQGQTECTFSFVGDFIYDPHDENDAIVARVHLTLARQFTQHYEYVSAAMHAHLVAERAQRGIYVCANIRVSALSLLDEIEQS